MMDALKAAGLFLGFLLAGTVLALAWVGLVLLAWLTPWFIEIIKNGVLQLA